MGKLQEKSMYNFTYHGLGGLPRSPKMRGNVEDPKLLAGGQKNPWQTN